MKKKDKEKMYKTWQEIVEGGLNCPHIHNWLDYILANECPILNLETGVMITTYKCDECLKKEIDEEEEQTTTNEAPH